MGSLGELTEEAACAGQGQERRQNSTILQYQRPELADFMTGDINLKCLPRPMGTPGSDDHLWDHLGGCMQLKLLSPSGRTLVLDSVWGLCALGLVLQDTHNFSCCLSQVIPFSIEIYSAIYYTHCQENTISLWGCSPLLPLNHIFALP